MSLLKIYQGQALQMALNEINSPVAVTYLAVDQPESDTVAALADLIALTPHLSMTTPQEHVGEADRVIIRGVQGRELVFVGAPLGTELAALVSAIVVTGRGDSGLTVQTRQTLADLGSPVHLEVFTTPI
jgi:alkyl hydroperoxide reductase subunit AhpF